MIELVVAFFGFVSAIAFDVAWRYIDYSKAEKGLEAHEHYHIGLELVIVSVFLHHFAEMASWFALAAGVTFFMSEWHQIHWIKDNKVIPGHPFAYGSSHFKQSTIIGIVLAAVLAVSSYFFLV